MKRTKKVLAVIAITMALSFTTTESHAGFWKEFLEFWSAPGVCVRPPNQLGAWNWF